MHILVPKHIILSQKEEEELLKVLNISKSQLPKIIIDDPALPEGVVVGNIVKILRKDGVYYRVVI